MKLLCHMLKFMWNWIKYSYTVLYGLIKYIAWIVFFIHMLVNLVLQLTLASQYWVNSNQIKNLFIFCLLTPRFSPLPLYIHDIFTILNSNFSLYWNPNLIYSMRSILRPSPKILFFVQLCNTDLSRLCEVFWIAKEIIGLV